MATTVFSPGSYTVSGISPAQTGIAESFQAGLQANLTRQEAQQRLRANEQLMQMRRAQEERTKAEYEESQRRLAEERAAAIAYGKAGIGTPFSGISTAPAIAPTAPTTPIAGLTPPPTGAAPTTPTTPRAGIAPPPTGIAGTPSLFDAMQQVESANIPTAVSPKGAVGLMQVMPATARDPGFGLPSVFDYAEQMGVPIAGRTQAEAERLLKDPAIGRGYGEMYMNAMLEKYNGDVATALIAYNAGPGFTDQWLAAGADPNRLPAETRNYVAKITGLLGGAAGTVAPAPAAPAPVASTVSSAIRNLPGFTEAPAAGVAPVQEREAPDFAGERAKREARIKELDRLAAAYKSAGRDSNPLYRQAVQERKQLREELDQLDREEELYNQRPSQQTFTRVATFPVGDTAAGVQPTTGTPVQQALEEATVNDEGGPSRIYAVAPERIFRDQQTLVENRQSLEALATYYQQTNNVAGLASVREELKKLNREQWYLDGMTAIAAIQQENFGPIQTLLQQARPDQQIEIRPYTDGTVELFVNGQPSVVEGTGEYRPTWGEFVEHLQSLYDRDYIANVLAATERVRAQQGIAYEAAVKETAAMEREIAVEAAKAASTNPNIEWQRDTTGVGYATYVTPDGSVAQLISVPAYPFEGIGGKSEPGPAILMLMPDGQYSQPVYIAPDGSIRAAQ